MHDVYLTDPFATNRNSLDSDGFETSDAVDELSGRGFSSSGSSIPDPASEKLLAVCSEARGSGMARDLFWPVDFGRALRRLKYLLFLEILRQGILSRCYARGLCALAASLTWLQMHCMRRTKTNENGGELSSELHGQRRLGAMS